MPDADQAKTDAHQRGRQTAIRACYQRTLYLYIISKISASGATGYAVEYAGSAIRALSMEARMTICNMSIEMGARCGMIAPDETTFNYMKGRKFAPQG